MSDPKLPGEWDEILSPSKPRDVELYENDILLYGRPKIGKTTFASQIPKALHLDTEGGGAKHAAGAVIEVIAFTKLDPAWVRYEQKLKSIKADGGDEALREYLGNNRPRSTWMGQVNNLVKYAGIGPFQVVVIDTIDKIVEYANDATLSKFNIKDLGDLGYGKGWKYMRSLVRDSIQQLKAAGYSLVFVSHAEEKTVSVEDSSNPVAAANADVETGEFTSMSPTIPDKAMRKDIPAMSNMILYADILRNGERVLHTQPTAHFHAGDHSNRLPDMVPLNWEQFVEAYYGGADDARNRLMDSINKGEKYLTEHGIEFEPVSDYDKRSLSQLQSRVKHLQLKAKSGKKATVKEAS